MPRKRKGKAGTPQTASPPVTPAKVCMIQLEEPDVIRRAREKEKQFGEVDKTVENEGITIARVDKEGGEEMAPEWKLKDKDKFFAYITDSPKWF